MRPLVIALLTVLGACYAARLDSTYLPPGSAGNAGGAGFIHPPERGGGGLDRHGGANGYGGSDGHNGPTGFGPGNGGAYSNGGGLDSGRSQGGSGGQDIPIISYNNDNIGDGNYQYSYETGNGITVQETGHQQGESESVSGSYSYTGPDGVQYSITYTADEYGFHPEGAHLPTPPPIPPEIQRGVELALAAEARGENQDDGWRPQEGTGYSNGGNGHQDHGNGHVSTDTYQGPNSYQVSSGGGYRY